MAIHILHDHEKSKKPPCICGSQFIVPNDKKTQKLVLDTMFLSLYKRYTTTLILFFLYKFYNYHFNDGHYQFQAYSLI